MTRRRWPCGCRGRGGRCRWASSSSVSTLEFLVHTWDLAQAAGQAVTLDPDLVRDALEPARQFAPLARLGDMIGPERAVPPDAGDLTKLLAICGRQEQAGKGH